MLLPSMPRRDTLRGEIIISLALGRLLHRFRRHGTVAHFLEYLRESRHFWSRGAGASPAVWVSFESLPPTSAHGGGRFRARTCAATPAIATKTITAGTIYSGHASGWATNKTNEKVRFHLVWLTRFPQNTKYRSD